MLQRCVESVVATEHNWSSCCAKRLSCATKMEVVKWIQTSASNLTRRLLLCQAVISMKKEQERCDTLHATTRKQVCDSSVDPACRCRRLILWMQMATAWPLSTTLQLQLIQPEKYAATVESLTTLLPTVAAHRKAEKDRAAEERRLTKAAKAKAFNYRLEQILSAHGGAAAVVVGNGAQSAVRSWDSQCQDLTGTEQADNNGVSWREKRLHWSGEERKMSGLRMSRLPKENLQRLAGTQRCTFVYTFVTDQIQRLPPDSLPYRGIDVLPTSCVLAGEHASDHPLQAKSRSWEAAQHQADAEIQHEEAEIMHEQLAEDLQRRKKVAASCDQAASEDEEELTFGAYQIIAFI